MTHVARRRPLGALLCCASVAAVALGLGAPRQARAQAFQGVPTIASGDASVSTGANTTDVLVNSDQVVIDWKAAATGSGAIDFLPAGATATFQNDLYFTGTTFTVLNRILPVDPLTGAAVNQAIAFNGTVQSQINGVTAGNVWFYSPNGIIAGPTSVFNVGSLVLTTNPIDTTGGLYGANGEIRFGTPVAGASIRIQPGAQINALMDNSYVAMVSPRIEQGGNVQVNGSTAYVAAEQADITINDGLFDIQIGVGADDPNGIVHTGATGGPATTAATDTQRIYMVAVPKNDALTMLLSGTIGYTPATAAADEAGAVVLSAGSDVFGGSVVEGSHPGSSAGIAISNAEFTSALTGDATDSIAISADADAVRFDAATSLVARNSASIDIANGGAVDATGDLTLIAGHDSTGGTVTVDADGVNGTTSAPSALSVGGQLLFNTSATAPLGEGYGASATGGTIAMHASDGGQISADTIAVNASARSGFGGVSEGAATGGSVTITATNGSITANSLALTANPLGPDTANLSDSSLAGGAATGGTITLSSVDGGIAFDSATLLADAYGGMGTQTRGDATGGTIAMSVTGIDNDWGDLTASASANAGAADAGGVAGRGSGGHITLDVGGGATLAFSSASLFAQAQAYNDDGGGNVQRGGVIGVSAHDGGNLAIDGELRLVADAYGDKNDSQTDTGAAMTAFGGSISVDANGGAVTAAGLSVSSEAEADGSNGGRGSALGGDVTIAARNGGTLHLNGNGSFLSVEARGSNGGYGADATGGTVDLYASDGTITVDSGLGISADAMSGASFNDGVAGGSATGGSVTVENRAGVAGTAAMTFGSLSIESAGDASVPGEGHFFSAGDGGRGVGGTVAINLAAGTFSVPELDVSASGDGGSAVPA
jgi:filamentous hemagglutinin family protein